MQRWDTIGFVLAECCGGCHVVIGFGFVPCGDDADTEVISGFAVPVLLLDAVECGIRVGGEYRCDLGEVFCWSAFGVEQVCECCGSAGDEGCVVLWRAQGEGRNWCAALRSAC